MRRSPLGLVLRESTTHLRSQRLLERGAPGFRLCRYFARTCCTHSVALDKELETLKYLDGTDLRVQHSRITDAMLADGIQDPITWEEFKSRVDSVALEVDPRVTPICNVGSPEHSLNGAALACF